MQRSMRTVVAVVITCAAVAAIPAMASANQVYSGSTLLPVGTGIVGQASGSTTFSDSSGASVAVCDTGSQFAGTLQTNALKSYISLSSFTFSGSQTGGRCSAYGLGQNATVSITAPWLAVVGSTYWAPYDSITTNTTGSTLKLDFNTGQSCTYGMNGSVYLYGFPVEPTQISWRGTATSGNISLRSGTLLCPATLRAYPVAGPYTVKTAAGANLHAQAD